VALAQVTSAQDGTQTRVNQRGNQFDIDGGSRSSDGRNLFHSFDAFGLSDAQIANFLSNPEIRNILSRVVGGNASVIDGLIRVTGGNSNLYLLNPSGVIFGPNARLDVPGSFTTTTATGIGFGDRWFSAFNPNDYDNLVGDPTAFAFDVSQPGAILNAGNLGVNAGESLLLLGGTVINTGTLSAPSGTITVAAVEGDRLVRISQDGALLSLELDVLPTSSAEETGADAVVPLTPLQLPDLLTGSSLGNATGVEVNADGTVSLTGSGLRITPDAGVAIASGNLDAATNGAIADSQSPTINVLGTQVALLNADLDTSDGPDGGTIRIGGDYQGGQATGLIDSSFNANQTYVDSTTVLRADGLSEDAASNGGRVIVWADQSTQFFGSVSARGGDIGGDGGFVEISGQDNLAFDGSVDVSAPAGDAGTVLFDPQDITISDAPDLITNPEDGNDDQLNPGVPNANDPAGQILFADGGTDTDFRISFSALQGVNGDVLLQASQDINLDSTTFGTDLDFVDTAVDSVTFAAGGNFAANGTNISVPNGDLTITAGGSITVADLSTANGGAADTGDITLAAGGDIAAGSLSTLTSGATDAGTVDISSTAGAITVGSINTAADAGAAGDVAVTVAGNLTVGDVDSSSVTGVAGNVALTSDATIEIGDQIDARGSDGSGSIRLTGNDLNLEEVLLFTAENLEIAASTADRNIQIGGTAAANTLNISDDELAAFVFVDGGLTIGRSDGSGRITVNSAISSDGPLTILSPDGEGAIAINADISTFDDVTLSASDVVRVNADITTQGGAIDITSDNIVNTRRGSLTTTTSSSMRGDAGAIAIDAAGDVILGTLTTSADSFSLGPSNAGDIRVVSENGSIRVAPDGGLFAEGDFIGNGGSVELSANGSIRVRSTIETNAFASMSDITAGTIRLTSATGNIDAADIPLSAVAFGGSGNSITLSALNGSVRVGDLSTSGSVGGDVVVEAQTFIQTGDIETTGSVGDGGDVTLDPSGDVEVTTIDTSGGFEGRGGDVDITAGRFFRATETFPTSIDSLTEEPIGPFLSIRTSGGIAGGNITIRHGGSRLDTPFIVGDATTNGTAGDITSGTFSISSRPAQRFDESVTIGEGPGTIRLITGGSGNGGNGGNGSNGGNGGNGGNGEEPDLPEEVCPPDCEDSKDPEPPLPPEVETTVAVNLNEARTILQDIELASGEKPALIYISFAPANAALAPGYTQQEAAATEAIATFLERDKPQSDLTFSFEPQGSDELEVVLVTQSGEVRRRPVRDVTRDQVLRATRQFTAQVSDPRRIGNTGYLVPSQQLYSWLIAPLEADLQAQGIENVAFVMESGLRSLPVAALHNGDQFLIERYSVGLMPSLSLVDTRYEPLQGAQVLAMGASEFDDQFPLPAVPLEIARIQELWLGEVYLDDAFTIDRLKAERQQQPFGIVHLATHGEFRPGIPENSYIQFRDRRLRLDQLRELNLNDPPVDLLVLSACRTALGSDNAELGFAGLALQAGVRSALASLWYVSDAGTLGLMTEFYSQLQTSPIKAEALRQAQLALLQGDVQVTDGQLRGTRGGAIALPETVAGAETVDLSHPFYWAAFTMIGSPW
jgi:filamentous hemagglutinin family protein